MFGLSVYISSTKEQQDKTISFLKSNDYCFISLHHPLDLTDTFKESALDLLNRINATGAKIIADIAPVGIEKLGFRSFKDMAKSNLVWGLRPDYGLSAQEIASASDYTSIVINASNIDENLVDILKKSGNEFYAMHNFYPRPETGLDIDYCIECTKYLHRHGAKVWAFISGDDDKRGSVFEGLPTIEQYRNLDPYVQYCLLKEKCSIDDVFLGDISMKENTYKLISETEKDHVLRLPCKINELFADALYNKVFTIRPDNNSIIARLQESRTFASIGAEVEPHNNNLKRNIGSITMDNKLYSVYSGEVQICLKDLQPDNKVNVIGNIDNNYIDLLDLCCRGKKIMFIKCL